MAVTTVLLAALVLVLAAPALAGKLIFEDNFNFLDEKKWTHQVSAWRGGNQEFQFYRNNRKNSYVKKGILYIKPTLTADEFGENTLKHGSLTFPGCNMQPCVSKAGSDIALPVLSARLDTHRKFSFKYGRLEIRARLPKGDWLWPAMWMMPEHDKYGSWPRSGEIDMTESRGNTNLKDPQGRFMGVQTLFSTLHFGPNPQNDHHYLAHVDKYLSSQTLADDFHVYAVDWTRQGIRFLLDGKQYYEVKRPKGGFWQYGKFSGDNIWKHGTDMAPFDQEFYIILNLAVGGAYFNDEYRNSPNPRPWTSLKNGHPMLEFWNNKKKWLGTWHGEQAALQVDWVRVYDEN